MSSTPSAPRPRRALWRHPAVALAAVTFGLMLALRIWIKFRGAIPGDDWAMTHFPWPERPGWIIDLGNFFSVIGLPALAIATVGFALVAVMRAEGVRGVVFVVAAGSGVFFNMLLKTLSGTTGLMNEKSQDALNYPSGHTVYAVVLFGALAWLAWRRRRFDVAAPLAVLIVLMGPFRVIVEAHFVSDVIAGYLVGAGWLGLAAMATGYWPRRGAGLGTDGARGRGLRSRRIATDLQPTALQRGRRPTRTPN